MSSNNDQLECLKTLNSLIVDNQDIQKIVSNIKELAHNIQIQKRRQNITKAIQLCLKSRQYSTTLEKLTKLQVFQKDKFSNYYPAFPSDKIYFNPISVEQGSHSIALIMIPKGLGFSLHDHPDMLVLTKILYGQIEIQSMDIDKTYEKWSNQLRLDPESNPKIKTLNSSIKNAQRNNFNILQMIYNNSPSDIWNQLQLYQNFMNKNSIQTKNWKKYVLTAPNLDVITPFKSNIHSFTAKSDCIILDILLPDYINQENCNYYEYSAGNGNLKNPRITKVTTSKQSVYLEDLRDYLSEQKKEVQ